MTLDISSQPLKKARQTNRIRFGMPKESTLPTPREGFRTLATSSYQHHNTSKITSMDTHNMHREFREVTQSMLLVHDFHRSTTGISAPKGADVSAERWDPRSYKRRKNFGGCPQTMAQFNPPKVPVKQTHTWAKQLANGQLF